MHKIKHFINLDKEEAWLRSMSTQGWDFSRRDLFGYWFYRSDQGERIYRIDYRNFKSKSDYTDYLALFQDAGWEHVEGSTWSGYQYFASREGSADAEIFSDEATRAARYRRIAETWSSAFVVYLALFIIFIAQGSIDFEALANPAKLYLTPGLWASEGARFWFAFLFETPFALGRGFWWLVLPAFLLVSGCYLFRAWTLGNRSGDHV